MVKELKEHFRLAKSSIQYQNSAFFPYVLSPSSIRGHSITFFLPRHLATCSAKDGLSRFLRSNMLVFSCFNIWPCAEASHSFSSRTRIQTHSHLLSLGVLPRQQHHAHGGLQVGHHNHLFPGAGCPLNTNQFCISI